jgi:hypothetical protein
MITMLEPRTGCAALDAAEGWIETFIAKPDEPIGRAGPVCPFVPGAIERGTLWLAAERIAGRSVADVVPIIESYRTQLLAIRNPHFTPFKSPVPFLILRHAFIDDWMFFLEDEAWLDIWARRFGPAALAALAGRLRRTNWKAT